MSADLQEMQAIRKKRLKRVSRMREYIELGEPVRKLNGDDKPALADAFEGMSIEEIAAWVCDAYGDWK